MEYIKKADEEEKKIKVMSGLRFGRVEVHWWRRHMGGCPAASCDFLILPFPYPFQAKRKNRSVLNQVNILLRVQELFKELGFE